MPRKSLSMRKITEVLRLKFDCGATNREIAGACSMGVATVHEYLTRAQCADIGWPLPPDLSEQEIEHQLFPKDPALSATMLRLANSVMFAGDTCTVAATGELLIEVGK